MIILAKKGGIDYMELGLFIIIGYVAWKVFLGDLVDQGISKVKGAFPAQASGIDMTAKEDSWIG